MSKVWVVTVFESGDMTTEPWGVYNSKEKALERQKELKANESLNSDGNFLLIKISEHVVV